MTTDPIREVLGEHGRLSVDAASLADSDDLYELGMTSHASVSVMLALEETYGVEFPEYLLRKSTFSSIAAIRQALDDLSPSPGPGDGA